MGSLSKHGSYDGLIKSIGALLEQGRRQAIAAVNQALVRTYWELGKRLVEYEQKGNERAEYGSALLTKLSGDLKLRYGAGFSKSNVYLMRLFYLKYGKFQTVSGKLSWSHYSELLSVDKDMARQFYEKQCIHESWSVRELKRQTNSSLFERLALSRDKRGVLELSKKGQKIERANDILRDPYVFEFLKMPETATYQEKDIEQSLIDNLQLFLLELGKGFTFVKRQFRITLDNTHYYADLVFYHRILKCFVLIDLKAGKVTPQDVGQMNMYLNYFKFEENSEADNEPIGIILSAKRNNIIVRYALGGITNRLFLSKYRLYLPDKKELENKLKETLEKD